MLVLHRLVRRSRLRWQPWLSTSGSDCTSTPIVCGLVLPHTQHSPANLIVFWPLESLFSALLALATFSSALRLRHSVDDTLLVRVLLGAKDLPDLHKHFVVRVKAVGVEHKMVGKVSVGVFVDVLPRDRVVLSQLFLKLVESCNDVRRGT